MLTYDPATSAVIGKTKERWGTLHCMAGGMPLSLHGMMIPSAEHLYQSLRTHDKEVQMLICAEPNPFKAKRMVAYRYPAMPTWDSVRVDAMRYTLRVKWLQQERFRNVLLETGSLPIVERSVRDSFWGAIPKGEILEGSNVLGNLLMELRSEIHRASTPQNICSLDPFLFLSLPLKPFELEPSSLFDEM